MEPVPALVTLQVWRVAPVAVPRVLGRISVDRTRARRVPGVRFCALLGTGRGFGASRPDATRWAKLTCWSEPGPDPVARAWDRLATDRCTLSLRPLTSTGRWRRREPFGTPTPTPYDGPVAALTRARLRPVRARQFWQAVPPVEAAVHGTPGLQAALAVGEAPVGLQGTFSVWDSPDAVTSFTSSPAHRTVVAETHRVGWYAEDLFARFAVEGVDGPLELLR